MIAKKRLENSGRTGFRSGRFWWVICAALLVLTTAVGSAAEMPEVTQEIVRLRADVNLLKREVAAMKKELAALRQKLAEAIAAMHQPDTEPGKTEPSKEPPRPSQVGFPSLSSLFATVPAKFMPAGTKATALQIASLKKWAEENLSGKTLVVRMKIRYVSLSDLKGDAVEPVVVHGRKVDCRIDATFPETVRESLLPLAEGMTVKIRGKLEEIPIRAGVGWKVGWTADEASFTVYLEDCRLVR